MLSILRSKLLPVQFAIFALVLNAFTQVQCCVGAIESTGGNSFWAEAQASLCLTDGEDAETDTTERHAAFELWAQAMGAGAFEGHAGHGSGDGSGDCDCADGICAAGLVALAALQEVSLDTVRADSTSPSKEERHFSAHDSSVFSARGPPHILL